MGTKAHLAREGRALPEDEEAVRDAGVEVDESEQMSVTAPVAPVDESGFAAFAVTGTLVSGEFRCADCGYGAVFHRVLPPCPMCGGAVWESREPRARILD